MTQFCWTRVTQQIEPALQPLLARGSILCSDGNQSYIKVAEMGAGIIHKRLIVKEHHRVEDDVFRIQTLNNYVNRWRGWMLKFHGVGTAYLANYLAWFRTVEQEPNTIRSWAAGWVSNDPQTRGGNSATRSGASSQRYTTPSSTRRLCCHFAPTASSAAWPRWWSHHDRQECLTAYSDNN